MSDRFVVEADRRVVGVAVRVPGGFKFFSSDPHYLALEGKLVPVTAHWNEELLRNAGFAQVECFWRWCNFAGWIAVKEG